MADGTVALTWGHLISCFLSPPVRPPTRMADLRRISCRSGPAHRPPNPKDRLSRDTLCPASCCLGAVPGEEEAPIRSFPREHLERNSCCHRAGGHTWPPTSQGGPALEGRSGVEAGRRLGSCPPPITVCAGPSGPHIPQTELITQSVLSVRIGAQEETGAAPRRLEPSQPSAGVPWGHPHVSRSHAVPAAGMALTTQCHAAAREGLRSGGAPGARPVLALLWSCPEFQQGRSCTVQFFLSDLSGGSRASSAFCFHFLKTEVSVSPIR